MRTRTLQILGAVVVAALILAWWLGRDPAPAGAAAAAEPFLTGFRAQINEVQRIEMDDGKAPLAVERSGSGWVDPARGGFPVKAEEVKKLLFALNRLEKREAKTADAARHGELQLALEGDEETRGTLVRVWTGGAEPAWELVAGRAKWSPVRGIYARLKGENQCWFLEGELQLPYAPTAWLDKEMANVNALDVAKVVLVRGAETYTVSRADAEAPWALAELPAERALKDPSPFGTLANTLGYLNFDDVARADEERFARDPDLVAEFTCFNGASLRLTGWKDGEATWVRCEASPPTVAPPPPPPEGEVEGPQDGPRGPTAETIAGWSAKWVGWAYKLPDWKADGLAQGLEDWLEPLPAEEAVPAENGDDPGAGETGDGE